MKKNGKRILWLSAAFLSALILAAVCGLPAAAQQTASQPKVIGNATANAPIHFGDTKSTLETPGTEATTKSNGSKPAAKSPTKKSAKAAVTSGASRKVKR